MSEINGVVPPSSNHPEKTYKQGKRQKVKWIVLSIVLAIIIILLLCLKTCDGNLLHYEEVGGTGITFGDDPSGAKGSSENMTIQVYRNFKWLPDGSLEVHFQCASSNTMPQVMKLINPDTKEVVYRSPIINPGFQLTAIPAEQIAGKEVMESMEVVVVNIDQKGAEFGNAASLVVQVS